MKTKNEKLEANYNKKLEILKKFPVFETVDSMEPYYDQASVLLAMEEYASQNMPTEEEMYDEFEKMTFYIPTDDEKDYYFDGYNKGFKACYNWILERMKR